MSKVNRTNDRVLMGELDSTQQAEKLAGDDWLEGLESRENPQLLDALGMLRFEALLSQKLIVTDAQALDGRIFLGLAMSGLLRELRPADSLPAIELRTRATSVQRSAWAMYNFRQGGAFRASFLTDGQQVCLESPATEADDDQVDALGGYLMRAGGDAAEVEALTAGWKAVSAAVRHRHVTLEPWDTSRPWDQWVGLAAESQPIEHLAALLGESPDTLDEARRLANLSTRSDLLRELESGGWAAEQRELLETWFHERYRRATAFQHRADYRGIHSGLMGNVYTRSLARESSNSRTTFIELPEWFIGELGRLPTFDWQKTYADNRRDLRTWWADGDTGALERVLMSFGHQLVPARPAHRNIVRSVTTLGLTLSSGVASLPLGFDATGVAATLGIGIGVSAATALAGTIGNGAKVKVTDYLDDVDPLR